MITFETQEDFEKAVMAVLDERLALNVNVRSIPQAGEVEVSVTASDCKGRMRAFCSDRG